MDFLISLYEKTTTTLRFCKKSVFVFPCDSIAFMLRLVQYTCIYTFKSFEMFLMLLMPTKNTVKPIIVIFYQTQLKIIYSNLEKFI